MIEIVEGEPATRFQIYTCDGDGKPVKCVKECDTIAEVNSHNFHLGSRWKIGFGRNYMTKPEFDAWSKDQPET